MKLALITYVLASLLNIVPCPQSVEVLDGSFKIKNTPINCDPSIGPLGLRAVSAFAADLRLSCTGNFSVATPVNLRASAAAGNIKGFAFVADPTLKAENYSIEVTPKFVRVYVADENAVLYSIQTLKQLLPDAVYTRKADPKASWTIPCCLIKDGPRFSYRGMHLDVARHFFSVDEIKKYLDVMAMYKLNRLHWHLTEDQGWRIEIKKYPRLTEVGSWRAGTQIGKDKTKNDGIRYGGYYTQQQVRELIAYAADRGITIIPEIDLPGHMLAAMSAYPELGCSGGPYEPWTRWGISKEVLCVGKESTMKFLEDVLDELADLFPSEYFHIGGDECPKKAWESCPVCQAKIAELGLKTDDHATAEQRLQNYVTARMQAHLALKGKKIIGWDEILEGDLAPGATVMSWRGVKGGIKAAQMGFDVLMTPNTYCYFDYLQGQEADEPLGIGGFLPLEKVYGYEPYDGMEPGTENRIIGVQANLWTEYIATDEHLEYMLLPRMLALSEIQWCPATKKNYDRFYQSLKDRQYGLLKSLGYNYKEY